MVFPTVFLLLCCLIPIDIVIIEDNSVGLWIERKIKLDWPVEFIEEPSNLLSAIALRGYMNGSYHGCILEIGTRGVSFMDF